MMRCMLIWVIRKNDMGFWNKSNILSFLVVGIFPLIWDMGAKLGLLSFPVPEPYVKLIRFIEYTWNSEAPQMLIWQCCLEEC